MIGTMETAIAPFVRSDERSLTLWTTEDVLTPFTDREDARALAIHDEEDLFSFSK